MYKLKISGKEEKPRVEFLTIGELSELCGRTTYALRKLVQKGILPDANFRLPEGTNKYNIAVGKEPGGIRLYSKEILVPRIVKVFKGIKRGKAITIDQKKELLQAFMYEKFYFESY